MPLNWVILVVPAAHALLDNLPLAHTTAQCLQRPLDPSGGDCVELSSLRSPVHPASSAAGVVGEGIAQWMAEGLLVQRWTWFFLQSQG
jgi:hypothetical protein